MGRNVFVSYKYSDGVETKDNIMKAIGNAGSFYKGEKGYNPIDKSSRELKEYLADMIFSSTVTVVVISPMVKYSKWVEWELKYSLERITRNGIQSKRNGIVCVIQSRDDYSSPIAWNLGKYNKNSKWAYNTGYDKMALSSAYLPQLVVRNMKDTFRVSNNPYYYLDDDQSNASTKDYCIVVAESTFIKYPKKYIEQAYERANDSTYTTETR